MKVISLLNEKGGVGKTTIAMHLAAGLAVRGYRTLLIDADAQANATAGLGLPEAPGFYDLLVRQANWNDLLRVLPAEMYEPPDTPAKGLLAMLPGNGETQLIAQKIDDAYAIYDRLAELEDSIDVVVFDTSPTPSLLHGAIYLATDAILYPTLCETFSLQGLMKTMKHHESFAENRKAQTGRMIHTLGIVPTMYRAKTVEHSENLNELRGRFGNQVWDPLSLRITWSEANTLRRPVFSVAPNSQAAHEAWGAVDRAIREISYV
ncbi:MAG: ParA family protein [Anaerolineaceae bacterium]|nr:MAG: ParA family protein [Anaerolineaceae bacterium]